MKGASLGRKLLEEHGIDASVIVGDANCYVHGERLVVLRAPVYHGKTAQDFAFVAHEVAHARQEARHGWIAPALRWLVIGRLLLEWDASRRAVEMLAWHGIAPDFEALRRAYRSYLVPAIWQTALLLLILGAWLVTRR